VQPDTAILEPAVALRLFVLGVCLGALLLFGAPNLL
jgi:hypothetical protein